MKRNSSRSEHDLTSARNSVQISRRRKPPVKSRVGYYQPQQHQQHHQEVVNTRLSFSAMNINELQYQPNTAPRRLYCGGSEQNMLDSRISLYSIGLCTVDCVNQVSRLILLSTICWNVSNPPLSLVISPLSILSYFKLFNLV